MKKLNVAKNSMTVDEFKAWLQRAYKHMFQASEAH